MLDVREDGGQGHMGGGGGGGGKLKVTVKCPRI